MRPIFVVDVLLAFNVLAMLALLFIPPPYEVLRMLTAVLIFMNVGLLGFLGYLHSKMYGDDE